MYAVVSNCLATETVSDGACWQASVMMLTRDGDGPRRLHDNAAKAADACTTANQQNLEIAGQPAISATNFACC